MEETPFPPQPTLVSMAANTETSLATEFQDSLPPSLQVTMVTSEAPPSNTPPITTISANALVEILNSVASAVLPNSELVVGGADQQSSATPPLQLQFHLPSNAPPTCNDELEDEKTSEVKRKGKSNGRGQKNKGKEKQPWHYHLGELITSTLNTCAC